MQGSTSTTSGITCKIFLYVQWSVKKQKQLHLFRDLQQIIESNISKGNTTDHKVQLEVTEWQ